MLDIRHVTKRYGKLVANHDISFSVDEGKIAILMGPNGAGKSTIIKCIAGLLRFEGEITIGGFPNKSIEAKKLLGYVPEMPALYEALTVAEHLEFLRRTYKVPEDKPYTDALLERFELYEKRDTLAKELSKGMQQKLSILCALTIRPRAIIFDEPLVGLDPYAIRELTKLFRELREAGVAQLISTHMISTVEDYWDVVHIMNKGEFAATRYNNECHEQSLEELFFQLTGEDGKPITGEKEES
ncbi:MAG: ABC transporter ATP-binding protein [Eubacteriales bacterium]|jgi:ABC-2 type transport system ATP-binding protein